MLMLLPMLLMLLVLMCNYTRPHTVPHSSTTIALPRAIDCPCHGYLPTAFPHFWLSHWTTIIIIIIIFIIKIWLTTQGEDTAHHSLAI